MVKAHSSIAALAQEAGARNYPNESCGLVVKKGRKVVAIECHNVSATPTNRFAIAPEAYAAASDMGEIIGVWHTHIEIPPTPSGADRSGCEASEVPWYIVAVYKRGGEFVFSDVEVLHPHDSLVEYVGRPYIYGQYDCYSLLVDYYRREFNIALDNSHERVEKWWLKGGDCFGEKFAAEGFVQIQNATPEVGDVFLIQTGSPVPNHIAIYTGNERILHHLQGRLSGHDIYGGYWFKHTVKHLRHKTKCSPQ